MASRIGGHRYPRLTRLVPYECQGYRGVGVMRIHLGQNENNVFLDLINNRRVRVMSCNIVLPSLVLIFVVALKKRGQFPKIIVPISAALYSVIDSSRSSYFVAGLVLIVDIRAAGTC